MRWPSIPLEGAPELKNGDTLHVEMTVTGDPAENVLVVDSWEVVEAERKHCANCGCDVEHDPNTMLCPEHPRCIGYVTEWMRDPVCVDAWPECESGMFDPRCCRFPKSCSCMIPEEKNDG